MFTCCNIFLHVLLYAINRKGYLFHGGGSEKRAWTAAQAGGHPKAEQRDYSGPRRAEVQIGGKGFRQSALTERRGGKSTGAKLPRRRSRLAAARGPFRRA